VSAYVGSSKNLKDLKDSADFFYRKACRWAWAVAVSYERGAPEEQLSAGRAVEQLRAPPLGTTVRP
jgi:hypothetical protein